MNDLHTSLTNAYNTQHAVMLPGSGTYAMEAAARAFGHEGDVVVVRNSYFSYRWSQLFECMGKSDDQVHVMKARPVNGWRDEEDRGVQPPPIEEVVAKIRDVKPSMVCAPHVETSAGIILNKDYCKQIGDACKEVGATFCLDGVASGTAWVDMDYANIGAYITAPQKGWSGPAAVGVCMTAVHQSNFAALLDATPARRRGPASDSLVDVHTGMMSDEAAEKASHAPSTSFTVDLHKWKTVMGAYRDGGHMYHATMPTDAIKIFRDVVHETEKFGLKEAEKATWDLGMGVRKVLKDKGYTSVAAEGWEAPGVAVVYANNDPTYAGHFTNAQFQIAAGVPLVLGEPDHYNSFRIGLFGLDKLMHVDKTIRNFEVGLDAVMAAKGM